MSYTPPTTEEQERDNLIETFIRILSRNSADYRAMILRKTLKELSTEKLINIVHDDMDGQLCGICHVGQMVRKGSTDVCNACGEPA